MKFLLSLLALSLVSSCSFIVKPFAGNFSKEPQLSYSSLSKKAKQMITESFNGIDFNKFRDVHVHLVGIGQNNSGAWVNPSMQKGFNFYKRIQYAAYMSASGIDDEENADQQYIQRLFKLTKGFPEGAKFHLLAFDKFYDEQGRDHESRTNFYIPNDYLFKIVTRYPETFIPVISIHPYRKDALEKLEFYAKKGARFVKWLPNAMGIDARHSKSMAFMERMRDLDMVLLTHIGEERAVDGEEFQALGNPLLFRPALELGVKIIMSHLASLGDCEDIESERKTEYSCYELFWRLFKDPKYEKSLFADISAINIFTRVKHVKHMMAQKNYHKRMVHGSDYPLPAINALYRTGQYAKLKLISIQEREILNEIYNYNPLVFEFVSKRRMTYDGNQIPPSVFELPEELLKSETTHL